MIFNFICWGWILITAFSTGFGLIYFLKRYDNIFNISLDYILVWGLCIVTVYAQAFSLVYKVSGLANLLLGLISLIIILVLRKSVAYYVKNLFKIEYFGFFCIFGVIFGGTFLWMCSGYAIHYDTDLYHGQMIRWIEEYGVVKGLGNLHNRFAYNSAFFSLQALYSLKFAAGQSLHSVNGLVTVIFLMYAVCTLSVWKRKRLQVSDFIKLGFLVYYCGWEQMATLASPGSDNLTLSLVLYIMSKWAELAEEKGGNPTDYGLLCMLAVWALTLKLSAGLLILLAIYPAVRFLQKRRWKEILFFVLGGTLILFPFLARNVIISGYLLYPYASLDLFNVDWKMPASMADFDKLEIMAWGRGMTKRSLYESPFTQWFPVWYQKLSIGSRVLLAVNIVSILVIVFLVLYKAKKKKTSFPMNVLIATMVAQLVMWFLSAPLMRYGSVYLFLLPAVCLGTICSNFCKDAIAYVIVGLVVVNSFFTFVRYDKTITPPIKRPIDYNYRDYFDIIWEEITVYIPLDSDCIGYHYFPSAPSEYRLTAVELRGESLAEGFKIKEEYKDAVFTTYGPVPIQ